MLLKQIFHISWLVFLGCILCFTSVFAGLAKAMKPGAVQIADGEYLRMGQYTSGEKTADMYFVSRVDEKNSRLETFLQEIDVNYPRPLPGNYSNYQTGYYFIDIARANLIQYRVKIDFNTNQKGIIEQSLAVDETNLVVNYTAAIWDGYETRHMKSRIQYKPGYPIWEFSTVILLGVRMLDIQSGGQISVLKPDVLKDAIPCSFSILGREEITTPAGRFKTVKVGFAITDPFMAKLMAPYTREITFWVEDAPRALIVKVKDPSGAETILEEVSNIKPKNK